MIIVLVSSAILIRERTIEFYKSTIYPILMEKGIGWPEPHQKNKKAAQSIYSNANPR